MPYLQNPDNRYRVVDFYPTLDNLKEAYAGMYKNYDGGLYSLFDETMKATGYTSVEELIESNKDFVQVLYKIMLGGGEMNYLGLQEIETGKINLRFYNQVYSYHPELGYAILGKEHERDYLGFGWVVTVVSLKNGKQFPLEFLDDVSGIKDDLTFIGYALGKPYHTFKIDEINDELIGIECPVEWNKMGEYFPDVNHGDFLEYGIEEAEYGNPFFKDPDFILTVKLEQSKIELIPKNLPSVS